MRLLVLSTLTAAAAGALMVARPGSRASQEPPAAAAPAGTLTAAEREALIDAAVKKLNESYVFPDVAKRMEETIRGRAKAGEFDQYTSGDAMAMALTRYLQEVSKDKHLRVRYSREPLPERRPGPPSKEMQEQYKRMAASANFGFEKVERLPGNVGYIDLRGFMGADLASETGSHAMNFVANTDALIIDLRKNGGGDPEMVRFLCSYLFDEKPVHLNSLHWREGNRVDEFWTLKSVPGKRYLNKDVYVLTSSRTFSGAEEFTYNLQNLKRATIVGETTGGGAHPGGVHRLTPHFSMFCPTGRAVNPISKTNWEGTGVKPDVQVPADQALHTAHVMALKRLRDSASAEPDRREQIERALKAAEKELEELKSRAARAQSGFAYEPSRSV